MDGDSRASDSPEEALDGMAAWAASWWAGMARGGLAARDRDPRRALAADFALSA